MAGWTDDCVFSYHGEVENIMCGCTSVSVLNKSTAVTCCLRICNARISSFLKLELASFTNTGMSRPSRLYGF